MTPTLAQLEAAWERSDTILGLVAPAALLAQPIPLRQPFLFYLGHLPAFAWNHACRRVLGLGSDTPALDELFERGIDPEDDYEAASSWPAVAEVARYRDRIRDTLRRRFADLLSLREQGGEDEGARTLALVLEHEWMHHETLLYMVHELHESQRLSVGWRPATGPSPLSQAFVPVPAGPTTLGADKAQLAFGWDNEFPATTALVPAFEIQRLPVTNAALLEFVEAGGYEDARHWGADGWEWRSRRGLSHPHFWRRTPQGWACRSLAGDLPLADAADWPALVSWAEADAYARFRGFRLPTEPELHRATYGSPDGQRLHPWGDDPPAERHGNFGFRALGPEPVGSHPEGASAWGVHELVGNGWEWTSTPFAGFPGFEPMRGYPGYSKDFFDGRHRVLLGASWATHDALLRPSFRNWFQPHYPYVFAKLRCVRGL